MLSYDKWKMLNESLGSTVLGLGRKQALGLISNIPGIGEPELNERDHCPTGECGEADEVDGDEDLTDDAAVDLEDYSDEYDDDVEEVESEDEDEEEDVEDEDYEEEEDYDDETEGEDEDFEDETEDEEEDEEEEDDDTDGNKEYEDEDVEFEDEDSDGDMAMGELGMDTQSNESKSKNNGLLSEADWWASVTSQVGQMTPSGDIKMQEAGVTDIIKFASSMKDGKLGDKKKEELKLVGRTPLDPGVKRAVVQYVKGQAGGAGESASPQKMKNLLALMVALTMTPAMKKEPKKLAKQSALRILSNYIQEMMREAEASDVDVEEEEIVRDR